MLPFPCELRFTGSLAAGDGRSATVSVVFRDAASLDSARDTIFEAFAEYLPAAKRGEVMAAMWPLDAFIGETLGGAVELPHEIRAEVMPVSAEKVAQWLARGEVHTKLFPSGASCEMLFLGAENSDPESDDPDDSDYVESDEEDGEDSDEEDGDEEGEEAGYEPDDEEAGYEPDDEEAGGPPGEAGEADPDEAGGFSEDETSDDEYYIDFSCATEDEDDDD